MILIALPFKYVKVEYDNSTMFTYTYPEVNQFLQDNGMDHCSRVVWCSNGKYQVEFENDDDAVIFKLAFL